MKIDPKQMRRNSDGTYAGEVTPIRFLFSSTQPVYPIRITQISVKTTTEALFYVLSKNKVDFPGRLVAPLQLSADVAPRALDGDP